MELRDSALRRLSSLTSKEENATEAYLRAAAEYSRTYSEEDRLRVEKAEAVLQAAAAERDQFFWSQVNAGVLAIEDGE